MRTQPPLNILWLTDIHFSTHYNDILYAGALKKYVFEVLQQVGTMHDSLKPIDYIFLTGDLAQGGTTADYEEFWKVILKPLLDYFLANQFGRHPIVLAIPGNHDVNWDNGDFIEHFVGQLGNNKKSWPKRKQYLTEHEDKFNKLFEEYTAFLISCSTRENSLYKDFFDLSSIQTNSSYSDKRLYGYIVDIKRQCVIILLNSAWYSLGDKFDKELAKKILNEPEFTEMINDPDLDKKQKYLIKKFKEKEYVSEYSTQVSGIHLMQLDQLNKILEKFPDFTAITCIHHPMNWLAWQEYYTYSASPAENANLFGRLLELTDILLTGHEHVPYSILLDKIKETTLHLKGGCFLTFAKAGEALAIKNNWFSFLKIDPLEQKLWQRKCIIDDAGSVPLLVIKDFKPDTLVKRHGNYILTIERETELKQRAVDDQYSICKLLPYLKQQQIINPTTAKLTKISPPLSPAIFECYSAQSAETEFFLLAKEPFSFTELGKDVFDWIEKMVNQSSPKPIFRFLVLDLFVKPSGGSAEYYRLPFVNREYSLRSIVNNADMQFDRFRHRFFIRHNPTTDHQAFRKLSDLRFANHVTPYWVYEKIWL